MKTQNKLAVSVLLAGGMGLGAYIPPAAAAFNQCPAIGNSPSCSILFTFGSNGSISTAFDTAIGPYDGSDDVLVGIQNNSGGIVNSIKLTGYGNGGGIFALEGDGLQTYYSGATGSYPTGYSPTGYEGPNTYFSNITTTTVFNDTGVVNFLNGLADGGSLFFSLEGSPASLNSGGGGITPGGGSTSVPEPGNLGLLGLGLALLGFGLHTRKRSRRITGTV